MNSDLIYQLSLCQVPNIGHVHAKILCEHFGSAKDIFNASQPILEKIEGIGRVRAKSIKSFTDFRRAEKEMSFLKKYGIQSLFLTDDAYPKRLLNCFDPPALLFYKGNIDLNASRIVSIVGTRNNSEYGRTATEKFIEQLARQDILIVSGLAFGIDAIAHKAAIQNGLPTIGVIGHGLDTIYPSQNTGLAKEMLKTGGLLTEFCSNTKPDKHHFPSRNRIVAGMSDAVLIMESGLKGGSMITAEIANSYNRDIFALPGRITDLKSAGCNELIRNNKAIILNDTEQFIETMGWGKTQAKRAAVQRKIFPELSADEKKIISLLREQEFLSIDELNLLSGASASSLATALLNLEMQNITRCLPGKRYQLTP